MGVYFVHCLPFFLSCYRAHNTIRIVRWVTWLLCLILCIALFVVHSVVFLLRNWIQWQMKMTPLHSQLCGHREMLIVNHLMQRVDVFESGSFFHNPQTRTQSPFNGTFSAMICFTLYLFITLDSLIEAAAAAAAATVFFVCHFSNYLMRKPIYPQSKANSLPKRWKWKIVEIIPQN